MAFFFTPLPHTQSVTFSLTASHIIMNMDYGSNQLKVWSGYILTLSKTWFINSNFDDSQAFAVLNRNKIQGIPEIFPKIKKLSQDK